MNKFPIYQQLDAMDCGATCLRMVARYYGRYYSLERLRDLTFMGKQGVSLLGISDAAEYIGLQSLAVKTSFDRLQHDVPLPAIAHWSQNHFVVIYKINKKYVWIGDPAEGLIRLSHADFKRRWISDAEQGEDLGVLLLLETTPEFYAREGEKIDKSGFGYVLEYFGRYKNLIFQLGLGLLVVSFGQLLVPFFLKTIVDYGVGDVKIDFIYMVVVAMFLLMVVQALAEHYRHWIFLHVGTRVNVRLISDFLIKLTKLPIKYFDTKMTGDLLQRINDHQRIQRFLTSTTLVSIFSTINFLVFGLILLSWSVKVFLIFLAGTALHVGWVLWFSQRRKDLDYKRFDQSADNQTNLIELINGMQEIKLHNAEKSKRWAWERMQMRLHRTGLESLSLSQFQRTGANIINETKNLAIILVASIAVAQSQMTIGMLVAVLFIVGQLNAPIRQIMDFIRHYQEMKISLERMNEIHQKEDEEQAEKKLLLVPEFGDLTLNDVSFQYNGPHSPLILNGVNLKVPRGKTTAIVGTSGSGKTTLLKLLLKYYEPTEGTIRLRDTKLSNIPNQLWREKCGVVMQDGYIFNDTIARNIALGDEILNKRKLLRAVKVANIQSFIESLPLGYNTRIGLEGLGLSQGQKQRLLIARAVYKNPDYIFFDEATSALDAYNEMVIMENLEDFFRNRTVIIVAHRLSTVMNADNIVVLEGGELVEQGTHEELTYVRGAYYQLVRNQLELGA